MNREKKITHLILHLFLIFAGIFFLLPFIWMISTSLKVDSQIFKFPPIWIPHPIAWVNYVNAVHTIPFVLYLKNTLFITVLSVIGAAISSPMVAYGLSRLQWKGRELFFILTLAVMMIPAQVTMIPVFIIFKHFNLVGTPWPLIIPTFFGVPFYIFLLRQFFLQLPKSLEDAARIDGCSEWMIYWKIMLPLIQPAVLTIALFQFMGSWNDFLGPLIYLNDSAKYTLQLGLQQFQLEHGTVWNQLMAASVLIAMPVILLYFFVQKSFIQGITFGGVKG